MIFAEELTAEEREKLLNEINADIDRTSSASDLTPKTESEETK